MFEPFVRGENRQEGTGLGLAIVKAIAMRIGAHVSLRNRSDGTGLVARFEVPARLVDTTGAGSPSRTTAG
jgi:signal transduction histidine kinase